MENICLVALVSDFYTVHLRKNHKREYDRHTHFRIYLHIFPWILKPGETWVCFCSRAATKVCTEHNHPVCCSFQSLYVFPTTLLIHILIKLYTNLDVIVYMAGIYVCCSFIRIPFVMSVPQSYTLHTFSRVNHIIYNETYIWVDMPRIAV